MFFLHEALMKTMLDIKFEKCLLIVFYNMCFIIFSFTVLVVWSLLTKCQIRSIV